MAQEWRSAVPTGLRAAAAGRLATVRAAAARQLELPILQEIPPEPRPMEMPPPNPALRPIAGGGREAPNDHRSSGRRVGGGGQGVVLLARFCFDLLPTRTFGANPEAKSGGVGRGARGRCVVRWAVRGAFAHPTSYLGPPINDHLRVHP